MLHDPNPAYTDSITNDSAQDFNREMGALGRASACAERYKPQEGVLSETELEYHYRSSFVIQQICDFLPYSAVNTFKGWSTEKKDEKLRKLLKKAKRWYDRCVMEEHIDAGSLGRLSGDCYLLLFLDDGRKPEEPIDYENLVDIKGMLALPEYDVHFDGYNYETSQTAYISATYEHRLLTLNDSTGTGLDHYHVERFIRIPGKRLPKALRDNRHNYSNQSILETFLPAFDGWLNANVGVIQMIESHSAFTLGMKNLAFKTKNKDTAGLAGRFSMIMSGMKNLKGLLYDADNEKADFISRTYSNIDKVLRSLDTFVASSCDIPLPFIFDGSEAYTSSSRGAREALASAIQKYQKSHLTPAIERLLWLWLHTQKSAEEVEDIFDDIQIDYDDGLILTREEEADLRFTITQKDLLLTGGAPVLHPEEVRSHWISGEWSDDIVVDAAKEPPQPPEPPAPAMPGEEGEEEGPAMPTGDKKGDTKSPLINTLTSKGGRSKERKQDMKPAKQKKGEPPNGRIT